MSDFLTREELLRPARRRVNVVTLPELDGKKVRVQSMTAGERVQWRRKFVNSKGDTDPETVLSANELIVLECVVDEHGHRMLTPEDIDALNEIDAAVVSRIADVAMKLSRLGRHEDTEELVGNSEGTHGSNGQSKQPSSSVEDSIGSAT